jgi:hypothetical protein
MTISRREFFQQLLSPKTLKKLSPLPSKDELVQLGETLGITPEPADACERAGLDLVNFPRKSLAGYVSASDSRKSSTSAPDDAGHPNTGE